MWMATLAAILRILPANTRKAWRHCPTSADTNSPKLAPIPTAPARGMTDAARKTETNAPGPSMSPWLRSATGPSGRFRASGRTTRSTPAPATPTVQVKPDVSTATDVLHPVSNRRVIMQAGSLWLDQLRGDSAVSFTLPAIRRAAIRASGSLCGYQWLAEHVAPSPPPRPSCPPASEYDTSAPTVV